MALRELYQRPHLELLGASVLGTHLLANFKLKGAPPKQDTSSTLQRFTGYFLVGTITMHVVHARVLPWYYDDPADLAAIYDSFSVYKPLALPLYSGLLLAGTYHTYNGIVTSLRRLLGVRLGMLGISGQLYPIYSFSFRLRR
ncbi:uncharacterized protein MONBRDRAFT_22338 [Monosiga brevicollis MX1]|uniref:Uncharacterized protein n=1 Tax=Monosiga brevicollis TaxID=81824 RepID=A9UQA3_MONBE|nr:uncharacterized protein MONBRDRAFT_22338 [Monosiga brevicollis MX1]EDQ93013.1 predicted protein [Monosiga brevicollis MX1]|eukprot:XP_001742775.1 hypothetical protein [Monosiga brevicollis MX1]